MSAARAGAAGAQARERRVAGVLLAAGRSERFGAPKLLAPLPSTAAENSGAPMAVAAYRHLAAAIEGSIAVVRPGAEALAAALREAGARVVECARADEGMGASLACGVAASADADAWVIALADMPWIATETIERVVAALQGGASIVAPCFESRRGHPVGFGKAHRAALLALDGDAGARSILAAHPGDIVRVSVNDPGVLRDVDVPGDLA